MGDTNSQEAAADEGAVEQKQPDRAGKIAFFAVVGAIVVGTMLFGGDKEAGGAAEVSAALTVSLPDEATALYDAYTATATPCRLLAQTAGRRMNEGVDVMTAYRAVSEAEAACTEAASKVSSLDPPKGADEATQKAFEELLDACMLAHWAKARGLGKLGKILDGNGRPSLVQETQEQLALGVEGAQACHSGLAELVQRVGGVAPIYEG